MRTRLRRTARITTSLLAVLTLSASVRAKPSAPAIFCKTYPQAPACASGEVTCATCHTSVPARNVYGASVSAALLVGTPRPLSDEAFASGLPAALAAASGLDPDGDSVASASEIESGSNPSDGASKPVQRECVANVNVTGWNLCGYDSSYAFNRVINDFCGRTATLEERASYAKSSDRRGDLHKALATCLRSEFWRGRDGVVWNLGAPKIRPNASIKAGPGAGGVPLADYDDDFALFTYSHLDDHDVRDVLTANYYVDGPTAATPTSYTQVRLTPKEDLARRPGFTTYQALEQGQRAGMITTRWFRAVNTMFSAVPRTTAAQAYRSYLGLDIALLQGLQEGIPAEPFDYDSKGVRAAGCINCHRTLDPLSYPFSRYEGLDLDPNLVRLLAGMMPGGDGGAPGGGPSSDGGAPPMPTIPVLPQYIPNRMERFIDSDGERILDVPESGVILGKPVKNVVEWAAVAANSPEFAQKVVLDYWRVIFGEEPRASDVPELVRLANSLTTQDTYNIEKMLHRLIDTEAYGAP
jgi:hypothetical protein